MAICIKCQTTLPQDAMFCPACGKKQVQEPRKVRKRANGTGTVYKLQGRRRCPWVAAKNKIVLGCYGCRSDAQAALEAVSRLSITERYNMTLEEVYGKWSEEHFHDLSPKGIEGYQTAYHYLEPLKDEKFRSLNVADYQACINQMSEKSEALQSKVKQLVSQMCQWAMREDISIKNCAPFLKLESNLEERDPVIYSAEEIIVLQNNIEIPTVKIILILIYTGMRINELMNMRMENVHLDERYMIGGSKTKAGRGRIIPISKCVLPYIQELYDSATDQRLMSGYPKNKIPRNFREREYYPILKKLGLQEHTIHDTRHTFASLMSKENVNEASLKKIIGHASIEITQKTYIHKQLPDLLEAIDTLHGY